MRLLHFLADLTRNADMQLAFSRDARVVMDQRELTPAEQELVKRRDAEAIGAAIARELRTFETEERFRWPSSSFEIESVEPRRAAAGSDVRVLVNGKYFPKIESCSLHYENRTIEGVVEALVTGADSRLEVTFSIPGDAPAGKWNVQVKEVGADRSEGAGLQLEIGPPEG
jgi:hypothetical protein